MYRDGQGGAPYAVGWGGWGWPPDGHETASFRRQAAYLASAQTYRQTALDLSGQVGWHITPHPHPAGGVGRGRRATSLRAGGASPPCFARGVVPVEGTLADPVTCFVEADGVWLSLQREPKRKVEARVAVIYTGKEPLGKGRWRLKDKVALTALVQNSQEWQERLLLTAYTHYQLSGTRQLVLGGDGSEWVRHSLDRFERPTCYQLDRYHLFTAARAAAPGVSELIGQACREGFAAIQPALQALIRQAAEEDRERLTEFYGYVQHNADGLIDYRLRLGLSSSEQPGLGAIEGNVDKLVVQRIKGRAD